MSDFRYRLSRWVKMATPGFITTVLLVISAIDFGVTGVQNFVPQVSAMSIFYWVIFWPTLLPVWFIFILGIFQDFLYGTALGVSSLINLLLWWTVVSLRKHLATESFWLMWAVFSFIMLLFALISGAIYSLYYGQLLLLSNDILMQWMFSALLYPFFHKLFSVIHITFLKTY